MNFRPTGEQLFRNGSLLPFKRRYPVRQEFTGCPNMISDPRRHSWRHGTPAPGRTGAERGFGNRQWSSQAGMGQQQMVVSQRQPHLFFKPSQILGEAVGTAGQTTILLSLGQVIPFHKTGVDPLTHRRLGQSGRHRRLLAKHDGGVHGGNAPAGPLFDDLGVRQVGARSPTRLGMSASCPASRRLIPHSP